MKFSSYGINKNVFVAGAGGQVGKALVRDLLDKGFVVKALVHSEKSVADLPKHPSLTTLIGAIQSPSTYEDHLKNMSLAINLVGITRGGKKTFNEVHVFGTQQFVNALKSSGVTRLIHFSSADAISAPQADKEKLPKPSLYRLSRWEGEEIVRKSGLDYTIFRPSLIHGPDSKLIKLILPLAKRWPMIVPGSGEFPCRPIYVEDVVRAVVAAIDKKETLGAEYGLGGPAQLLFVDLMALLSKALGKERKFKVHIPLFILKLYALLRGLFSSIPPYTARELSMLAYGSDCDIVPLEQDLGVHPLAFSDACKKYLNL